MRTTSSWAWATVALLTAGATTMAAVSNPEAFEGYAATGNWTPTQGGEGWALTGMTAPNEIVAGDSWDGSKALRVFGDDGGNGEGWWYATLGISAEPVQLYTVDFCITDGGPVWDQGRYICGNWGSSTWNWFLYAEQSTLIPNARVWLSAGTTVDLPGGGLIARGTWYTLQVEMNYTAGTVRARFNTIGSSANGWSSSVNMRDATQYGYIHQYFNGEIYLDHLHLRQAGLANPEAFERYPATSSWSPSQVGEGWSLTGMTAPNEIVDAASWDGSKALYVFGDDDNNGESWWYTNLSVAASPVQIYSADFLIADGGPTWDQGRIACGNRGTTDWSWYVYAEKTTNPVIPNARVWFSAGSVVDLPGGSAIERGTWYNLQVKLDYTTGTVKGRFNTIGSSANDWSDAASMRDATQYGYMHQYINGEIHMDNVSLAALVPTGTLVVLR